MSDAGGGWRGRARPWVARLAFPVVLTGALWAAHTLIQRGDDPLAAYAPAVPATFLVVFLLERLFPHDRGWLRSHGDIRVDLTYAVMLSTLLALFQPAVHAIGIVAAGAIEARWQGGLWPDAWPVLPQLALALVAAELPKYWWHRLQHTHDLLWRFHAPHHSVPRLYWLNASRFHPVDIVVDTLLGVGTLVALGCGDAVIALFLLVSTVHGAFQHANLATDIGWLNWLFSMAELHRWHHSAVTREANHNYGQNLIVWDVVFGTRYLPADREPPREIGLEGLPHYPQGFLAQQLAPFRWRRVQEESAAPPAATLG